MKGCNLQEENRRRLDNLYRNSHKWLIGAAYNITKNLEKANELVSELYLYLAERINPAIWYGDDSFNLLYLQAFLRTRNLNGIKRDKRITELHDGYNDKADTEYDEDFDKRLEEGYQNLMQELNRLEKTSMWASAKLYQLYHFTDGMTLEKLAGEIGLSKSTVFLNTRKIKNHLRNKLENPFRDNS